MHRYPSSFCLVAGVTLATTACASVQYRTDYDREADFVQLETYGWMLPTEEEQQALTRISPFLERRLTRALDRELTDRGYVETTDGNPDFWVSAYPVVPISDENDGADDGSVEVVQQPVRTGGVAVSVGFAGGFCCRGFYGAPYAPFAYPYGGFGYPRYGGYYGGYPGYGGYYGGSPGFGVGFYSVGGYGGYPSRGFGYPISASASGYAPGTLAVDVIDGRADELVWRGWAEGALFEPVSPERLADFIDEVVGKIMRDFPSVSEAQ